MAIVKSTWAAGQLLDAEVFADERRALSVRDWHNRQTDGRKAKSFRRQVKGGRASVAVWVVVARKPVPEGQR